MWFIVLGIREKIGKMTYGPYVNKWIDNVYMKEDQKSFKIRVQS